MLNVSFPGSHEIGKPHDMSDEQCSSAHAAYSVDAEGFPGYTMAYVANKEDLEALAAGRPLFVRILGARLAPHALFTFDADGNPNF